MNVNPIIQHIPRRENKKQNKKLSFFGAICGTCGTSMLKSALKCIKHGFLIKVCGTYVGHMWDICGTYVGHMWDICGTYVGRMWDVYILAIKKKIIIIITPCVCFYQITFIFVQ